MLGIIRGLEYSVRGVALGPTNLQVLYLGLSITKTSVSLVHRWKMFLYVRSSEFGDRLSRENMGNKESKVTKVPN